MEADIVVVTFTKLELAFLIEVLASGVAIKREGWKTAASVDDKLAEAMKVFSPKKD